MLPKSVPVRELAELTGLPELIVAEQLPECEVSLRTQHALRLSACNSHSRTEGSAKAQGNLSGPTRLELVERIRDLAPFNFAISGG